MSHLFAGGVIFSYQFGFLLSFMAAHRDSGQFRGVTRVDLVWKKLTGFQKIGMTF